MEIDIDYCMTQFLIYRYIHNKNKSFSNKVKPNRYTVNKKYNVKNVEDIDLALKEEMLNVVDSKTGILLSSGIDSAILAAYMPRGSFAYTLRTKSKNFKDETKRAEEIAKICGLNHKIVDITWDDYLKLSPQIMYQKGMPIHSIEPQLYKAAIIAREDGVEKLVAGDSADALFGGLDGLLSRDYNLEEFIFRFTNLDPSLVLRNPVKDYRYFKKYLDSDNKINVHGFLSNVFFEESINSFYNSIESAGIKCILPYSKMVLDSELDLKRIRAGESKYLLRELFISKFSDLDIIEKIPLYRPMDEWMNFWSGPKRSEFIEELDINNLSGDQKWLLFVLEWFLELLDSDFEVNTDFNIY